jgi:hypothetical protein
MSVIDLDAKRKQMLESYRGEPHSNSGKDGGGPGGPSDMERRIERLEGITDDLRMGMVRVDSRLENIEKNMLTRAQAAIAALVAVLAVLGGAWWMVQQYLSPILQGVGSS